MRFSKLIALGLALVVIIAPFTSRASSHLDLGSLGVDQELFWPGGYVTYDPVWSAPFGISSESLPRCDVPGTPCFTYTFTTTEAGERLRIGLDTPMRDDTFEVHVTDPSGVVERAVNSNRYSIEFLLPNPAVGTYTITVAPVSAEYADFRMRAKLESVAHAPGSGEGDLLPNLRVTRLWEFTFAAPLNPLNGIFPPDDINPPMEVLGYQPMSCAIDEQLGYDGPPASRCLRYSFGLANIGEGNFDVRFTGDRGGEPAPMTQCVQQRDGSPPVPRAAGTGSYHATHGHFHYDDIVHHTILRVVSPGVLEEVGTGLKIGYSPADQGMPMWHLFDQARAGTSGAAGDCTGGMSASRVGMSPGWGDAYRYQRPGNFVNFEGAGDGYYVVQTTADPEGVVAESNEDDNTSYAYIRVIGQQIDVIEAGLGTSPWDSQEVFTL